MLAGEADIPARTLQGFLTRYRDVGDGIASPEKTEEARKALGGSVLILDEASMVGTTQMRALTRIAAGAGAGRLALIGDRRQLRSVEAGQPFGLLQDAGMPTTRMDEVVRQRDADLRQAVLHMVAAESRMAVEELGNGVLETESDELGRKAAHLWLDLDPGLRTVTAVLAPTHELRAEINDAVRQGLEDEGVLHGPKLEIERYINLHLTRSQKGEVANYRPDDVAVFHHDVYGVKAKAGDACRVLETQDDGRVLLAHPDGRDRRIDPAGYIRYRLDLYETRPMVLKAGDHVRWTRNDASRSLINGEQAQVLSIGPVNVRMRTQDGREIAIARNDTQLHHLDHAYSSTVHAAKGVIWRGNLTPRIKESQKVSAPIGVKPAHRITLVVALPHGDAIFVKAYPVETADAFCDGHLAAFAFFGGVPQSILYDNTRLAVAKVLGDGTRKRSTLFAALQSHYVFEDRYGRADKGNDKGKGKGSGISWYPSRGCATLPISMSCWRPAAGNGRVKPCEVTQQRSTYACKRIGLPSRTFRRSSLRPVTSVQAVSPARR